MENVYNKGCFKQQQQKVTLDNMFEKHDYRHKVFLGLFDLCVHKVKSPWKTFGRKDEPIQSDLFLQPVMAKRFIPRLPNGPRMGDNL